ncbi:MAG: glycosyltransferase family 4 protein [Bacteroidetes bacterium]|nr:glycosyltransferase family 4 protein [Bacteroidota bacterium]
MRIFIICNKSPFPPLEGGPIAMNAIIQGLLRAGHQLKVLAINTNKYFIHPDDIPADYKNKINLEMVYIDLSVKPFSALINLLASRSYHIQRFITTEVKEKLIQILQNNEFDIVHLETLYVAPYVDLIRTCSNAKVVLRTHNIEHLIWKRIADNCRNPLKKIYLKYLYRTLKTFELTALKKFDGIASITGTDADFFRSVVSQVPVVNVPFGVNTGDYILNPEIIPEIPSLFHIGSMNWIPNVEGIKWFLDNVWPEIHKEFPDLKFYLAGRMMPEWLIHSQYPNVIVVGEVENALTFMQSKWIMIVPLFSGSGIRIKIIEAMTVEKTVISTSIGAEGINCKDGENILIADTPVLFAEAIRTCMHDQSRCHNIGGKARLLIEKEHDNDRIILSLTDLYIKISLA